MLRSFVMKNNGLKLVAVIFSFCLWLYVLYSAQIKVDKVVTINYNLPEHLTLSNKPIREVTYSLEGPRVFARTIQSRDLNIVIDLKGMTARGSKKAFFEFKPQDIDLPFGIKVFKITPSKIPLRLENKAFKILPIKVQFLSESLNENRFNQFQIFPKQIEVFGPQSSLFRLKHLLTKPIELEEGSSEGLIPLEISFPDERIGIVSKEVPIFQYKLKKAPAN